MSNSTVHVFPAPIGGVPFPHDFAPALIFTILYAIISPIGIWRMVDKRSRTLAILGNVIICIERVADFAIRAAEAEKPSIRTTQFFVSWLQSAYAMGYLSTTTEVTNLARLFLSSTTEGTCPPPIKPLPFDRQFSRTDSEEQPLTASGPIEDASSSYSALPAIEQEGFEDQPRLRVVLKRIGWFILALRILALLAAVGSGAIYYNGLQSIIMAFVIYQTRYASAVLTLLIQVICLGLLLWSLIMRSKRTPRGPAYFVCSMIIIIMIPTIYRLAVMNNWTISLTSTLPGSLNGPAAKALFYTFHIAPEWVVSTMLVAVNIKEMYNLAGGWKSH
ncbi:uncharacterized protein C8Q71DRAFT_711396 [Rhodofomes roseus]|uniref:Uncharacterized protein n=1 Tax=Rhodofomes roseus TaxID=34475 RepID=A0ABQ8KAC5_9APHY|nr:uncharacterized protein C8Q71DRAFT_711396 [Rhodofomes roseus]KAH9834393.1 hypothetical protein C8Q71DRAFT_711396 [Rhodofomes roseus]